MRPDLWPTILSHVTAAGGADRIRRHGLWCTADLLAECSLDGRRLTHADIDTILSEARTSSRNYEHERFGTVTVNHNKPVQRARLIKSLRLAGLGEQAVPQYFRALGERVFLWPMGPLNAKWCSRRDRFREAIHASGFDVDVVCFSLDSLLARGVDAVTASRFNSGSTGLYDNTLRPRSPDMWVPLRYLDASQRDQLTEVAWCGSLPDLGGEIIHIHRGLGRGEALDCDGTVAEHRCTGSGGA